MMNKPRLSLLTAHGKERMHEAVLRILSDIGMQIHHDDAAKRLKKAGCHEGENGFLRVPETLVEQAVQSAPKSVLIFDREGAPAMDLGDDRSYFGTGSDLLFSLDLKGEDRHRSVLQDVRQAALVCDALPNIDFIMSFAHPSDVPAQRAYLLSFHAMVEYSRKPIVCTAEGRHDLEKILEMSVILRGEKEQARAKPYFVHYAEPTSPLKHSFQSLDKLLFCANQGIPIVYSPAPMAGATGPITVAGHVAQGLAECLCGLVIHQLAAEGAPYIMGMGPAVMDMYTAQSSYNAPEYYLAYVAAVEMAHHYGLPCWGYAGVSDAQIPDGQATFEAGLCTLLSAMTGANLNHDVGYLDFGRTGSLEMIIIMNEVIDEMRHLRRGFPINDDTLGLDVIREAGRGAHFLSHPHTMKHAMNTQWRPKLLSRMGYEKWKKAGALSLQERARNRLREILATHRPLPLPEDKALAIKNLLARGS